MLQMDHKRPDGAVNNMKTLLSGVPVSSNKPFYSSLEFYFAGRCDINCDILDDVFVQRIFMNDISPIRCIRLQAARRQRWRAYGPSETCAEGNNIHTALLGKSFQLMSSA